MKKLTFMALLALAAGALATPSFAAPADNFAGARLTASAGVDDVSAQTDLTDIVYGGTIGVDTAVADRVTVGVEANVNNVFENRRDIGASARIGYAIQDQTLIFAKAGYANYRDVFSRDLDGLRVGVGAEHLISRSTFVTAEYRYSDFQSGVGNSAVTVGVGIRF